MLKNAKLIGALVAIALIAFAAFQLENSENPPSSSQKRSIFQAGFPTPQPILIDDGAFDDVSTALAADRTEGGLQANPTLIAAAQTRFEDMKTLIRRDPGQALQRAISYADFASLPPELKPYFEEPFSEQGKIEIYPDCGYETNGLPSIHFINQDGQRFFSSTSRQNRALLTKNNIPVQGIRIGPDAALRPQALHAVQDADAAFALASFPAANPNPALSFLDGAPLPASPTVAVAAGRVFLFASPQELETLNLGLAKIDGLPGAKASSQVLLAKPRDGFESGFQLQDAIDDMVTISNDTVAGSQTVLAILIDFSDIPGTPANPDSLDIKLNSGAADAFEKYSHGVSTIVGDVSTKTYRLDNPSADYLGEDSTILSLLAMLTEAKDKYEADTGADPSVLYDAVGVVFPELPLPYAGKAILGGTQFWFNGDPSVATIVHEFGHNFGLSHASYWDIENQISSIDPVDPNGRSEEYGDPFDVMGSGTVFENEGFFSAAAAHSLAWTRTEQVKELSEPSDNGTYRVYRFDHKNARDDTLGLRISKFATNQFYWASYRKGYETNQALSSSVYLQWERQTTPPQQWWLIDTTPGSAAGKSDAGLSLGRTYADTDSDVYITPVRQGGIAPEEYIDITVNFGPFNNNQSPSVTLDSLAPVDARANATLSAAGFDIDGDSLVYSWDFGDGSMGGSEETITHKWTTGGTFQVTVTASDMKGGTATATAEIAVVDPLNNWFDRSVTSISDFRGAASNETIAVISGSSPAATFSSTDGITWTERVVGLNSSFNDIVWTGTKFFGGGQDFIAGSGGIWSGIIYSSPDGITWTLEHTIQSPDTEIETIASNPEGSVILAGGRDGRLLRSTGNGTWTELAPLVDATKRISSIVWDGSRFLLAAHAFSFGGGFNGEPEVFHSTDATGSIWESVPLASETYQTFLVNGADFRRLRNLDDRIYGVGLASGIKNFKPDTNRFFNTSLLETRYSPVDLAYGNGVYFAIAQDEEASRAEVDLISLDGFQWLPISPSASTPRATLMFFNETFIVIGDDGLVQQSGIVEKPIFTPFETWFNTFDPKQKDKLSTDNPDDDWASNLIEYALGGSPISSADAPAVPEFIRNPDNTVSINVVRQQDRDDISVTAEVSTDLITWSPLAATTVNDTASLLSFISGIQNFDTPTFYRVRIELAEPAP